LREKAEKLSRRIQSMVGDMQASFLRARKAAEGILTPEQLSQVRQSGTEGMMGMFE
jgi:hypothetical protein